MLIPQSAGKSTNPHPDISVRSEPARPFRARPLRNTWAARGRYAPNVRPPGASEPRPDGLRPTARQADLSPCVCGSSWFRCVDSCGNSIQQNAGMQFFVVPDVAMTRDAARPSIGPMKNVGSTIKARRLELGLSMTELGGRVGVSWQAVQNWENNKSTPKRRLWEGLCAALGMTTAELFLGAQPGVDAPPVEHTATDWNSISQQAREVALAWDLLPEAVRNDLHARILHQWAVMKLSPVAKGRAPGKHRTEG